jgi:acetolactate synthase-1/3 small subunit
MAESKVKKYTIGALVSNKSGVLTRISGLFARRGYNIESLTVCATEDEELSRMTIILIGDEYMLYQMIRQMDKLEDVKKIGCANELDCVYRELLLVKVSATAKERSQIVEITDIYKAKVVDLSIDTMILELTGDPEKLDAFIKVVEPYHILEMQRTGVTVLARGQHTLKDRDCYGDHVN